MASTPGFEHRPHKWEGGECSHHCTQGRIQDFFRRGCTRLLFYFNTNKPHSFFCRIPVVLENRRSSQGGGEVRTPCTLPLDPPLAPTLFPNSFSTGRPHPFHYVSFHYLQKNFRVDHNPIPMFSLITVATTGQQQVTILTTLNTTDGFHSDVIKL